MKQHRAASPSRLPADGDVMLIGLFSGNDTEIEKKLDNLAAVVEAHGGRVAGRLVQRRGVSHGGAAKMSIPFSRRTLLSPGKAREVADACRTAGVAAVVFVNPLTEHQRRVLGAMFDCTVLSGEDEAIDRRVQTKSPDRHRCAQRPAAFCDPAPTAVGNLTAGR
jgi:hypothetical protein